MDNNSSDRSAAIVRQYPGINSLLERLRGDFAARKRGLAAAKGAIIAFTDSNCAPRKDWLQRIAAAAAVNPDAGIVLGGLQFAPGSPPLSMMEAYESEKAAYILSSNNKEIYVGYTSNLAIRRTLFDRLGPFSPIYRNSDIVFVRKAVDAYSCAVIRYFPEICVRLYFTSYTMSNCLTILSSSLSPAADPGRSKRTRRTAKRGDACR